MKIVIYKTNLVQNNQLLSLLIESRKKLAIKEKEFQLYRNTRWY